jgi:hypothetical protein
MSLRRTISILGICAAAAGAGAALSGCGASATLDPVAQAAGVTSQEQGAQIALTERLSGAAFPSSVSISGTGFTNFATKDTQITLDYAGIPGIPTTGGSKATVEVHYPVLYMKFPALTSQLPGNKPWIKFDFSKLAAAKGFDLTQPSSGGGIDPTQYLNYLRASGAKLTMVGRETINGVPTTHYTTTVDLAKVADAVPSSDRALMKSAVAQIEKATGSTSFPIDVWIDDQHRVRREQVNLTVHAQGEAAKVDSTIDFLSFGPTPTITPPPADQVFDLTSLATSGVLSSSSSGTATSG